MFVPQGSCLDTGCNPNNIQCSICNVINDCKLWTFRTFGKIPELIKPQKMVKTDDDVGIAIEIIDRIDNLDKVMLQIRKTVYEIKMIFKAFIDSREDPNLTNSTKYLFQEEKKDE